MGYKVIIMPPVKRRLDMYVFIWYRHGETDGQRKQSLRMPEKQKRDYP